MSNQVIRTVRFTIVTIIVILTVWYITSPSLSRNNKPIETKLATVIDKHTTPLAPFNLTDDKGKDFNQNSLRGQWTLMFFGYTTCPDICPQTLNIVKDTWNQYDGKYPAKFVFASINPNQDRPENLKNFLSNFHHEFIGVTGPSQEVLKLSGQLNVVAYKNEENKDLIDHSAALMLIDPKGRLKAIFTPPLDPNSIAADLNAITRS